MTLGWIGQFFFVWTGSTGTGWSPMWPQSPIWASAGTAGMTWMAGTSLHMVSHPPRRLLSLIHVVMPTEFPAGGKE